MTPNLDEKAEFLQDLDTICEEHLRKNKDKEMRSYITEFQNQVREELELYEPERDYYADKYAPTERDME